MLNRKPSIKIASLEARALSVVFQFLETKGYTSTVEELKRESGSEFERTLLVRQHDVLQKALSALDQETYMEKLSHEVDLDEEKELRDHMEKLKLSQAPHARTCTRTLTGGHQANILTVTMHPRGGYVASGDAGKKVVVAAVLEERKRGQEGGQGGDKDEDEVEDDERNQGSLCAEFHSLPSPVLHLDFNPHPTTPHLLLASCMNGSHSLLDCNTKEIVSTVSDHSKYALRVKWSPCGGMYATCSRDQTVRLYRKHDDKWPFVKEFDFSGSVEAIEWLGPHRLLVAVRDDNYLRSIDVETMQESSKYNMNIKGDDHVSFNAIDLVASADRTCVLACTDVHRMIMFKINGNGARQVRNFYGAVNDSYSNSRGAWSYTDKYVYCTSQDNLVYGWSVHNERVVTTLQGHDKAVRGLASSQSTELLASCSYDRTVKLWAP